MSTRNLLSIMITLPSTSGNDDTVSLSRCPPDTLRPTLYARERKDTEALSLDSRVGRNNNSLPRATVQMRIRIPPFSRHQPKAPADPNMCFTVKKAFAGDLGSDWTEDSADWPVDYKAYTSEDAFCEALKSKAATDIVVTPNGIVAHTLTLQPYTKPASTGNEDRHTVQCWELPSGQWTFVGVFDGAHDDIVSASCPV